MASFPRWIANQQPEALVVVPFARRKVVFAHVILGRPGGTTTCMGWAGSLPYTMVLLVRMTSLKPRSPSSHSCSLYTWSLCARSTRLPW